MKLTEVVFFNPVNLMPRHQPVSAKCSVYLPYWPAIGLCAVLIPPIKKMQIRKRAWEFCSPCFTDVGAVPFHYFVSFLFFNERLAAQCH